MECLGHLDRGFGAGPEFRGIERINLVKLFGFFRAIGARV